MLTSLYTSHAAKGFFRIKLYVPRKNFFFARPDLLMQHQQWENLIKEWEISTDDLRYIVKACLGQPNERIKVMNLLGYRQIGLP